MIKFFHVTKEYPRTGAALKNATFRVGRGEFVFLTGPSGSGKSTILKMCFGEERPTEGEVQIAGMNTSKLSRKEIAMLRRKLGIVFQDFRLLEDRTAEENIAFALEVTGAARDSIPGKVARLLTQVGLASKAGSLPRQLSGGEQQRVGIARALANDPYVVMADEPTGNLDERATRGVFQLLQDINMSGTAVLMATHDLELIRRADYRVIELNRGQMVYDSAESPAAIEGAED
jgi:cell division transport system ATP-binding protein